MPRKDVHLNSDGDIEIGYDGDLKLDIDDDVLVTSIMFRLKTYKGDYLLEPMCGASLEDLIGEPNTEETAGRAASMVEEALTHDGFLSPNDFTVRVVPIGPTKIMIDVTGVGERGSWSVFSELDLGTGLLRLQS